MRKRIAFLTMSADTHYIQELIRTMGRQAAQLGYELLVVTHFVNFTGDMPYLVGEENIYSILKQLHVDGAILAGATYYNAALPERLEMLLQSLHIPTIALDYESSRFSSCMQQSAAPFRMLTEHFITEHGFTDILCMTGPKGNVHAEQRLAGYRAALVSHGIPYREERVYYGDFWVHSGEQLAGQIIRGEVSKPQAVVCGNDYMALTLCLTLMSAGIRVPEEIAVGGYDGTPDIAHFHPSLTTVVHAYLQTGAEAVCQLHEQITGNHTEAITLAPKLKIGASCGCRASLSENAKLTQDRFEESQKNMIFMHSAYSSVMSHICSLTECAWSIAGNLYLLEQDSGFQVWLCTDWQGSHDAPEDYRWEGYSRKMLRLLDCRPDGSIHAEQQTVKPDSIPAGEQPSVWFLTPLHFQDRCQGICVRRFAPEQAVFERYYGEFCQVIANSLERLRMLEYEQAMQRKIEHLSERDILTGLYSRTGWEKRIREFPEASYFALLFDFGTMPEQDSQKQKQMIVTFAQAVNLSCVRGELSARISASRFVILGICNDSDMPEQLVLHTLQTSLCHLETQQGVDLSRKLQRITGKGTSPAALLARLEEQLSAQQDSETHDPYHAMLRKLHEQLYEAPQENWNAAEQAQRIGISLSHFQHLYQACNGISFHADVMTARMSLAGQLLRSTSLSVGEIAARCGYTDVSYFMKAFRKRTGMTAMGYRRAQDASK